MVSMGDMLSTGMGQWVATAMFLYALFQQFFPYQLREQVERFSWKIFSFLNPYIEITIREYTGERLEVSQAYLAIQTYLGEISAKQAKRMKASVGKDSTHVDLSMDDQEEITDKFEGKKFWWSSGKSPTSQQSISFLPTDASEKRYYKLSFHRQHREYVTDKYWKHVIEEGKAIKERNRERKLYTNSPSSDGYGYKSSAWSHVVFDHPSKFETLAMEEDKKKDIMDDLTTFSEGKEYYAKIGKAWKRGYLLYGPPGTGKSTMIAAIANHLRYDIYDLELTAVKDNAELRKLLVEISNKSVIVIEDIDCSLNFTAQRKKKKENDEGMHPLEKKAKEEKSPTESKVTLSGILNFIDGLWSSCGGERIIILTTNYVEKLDPALIRRGRMDKRIEMSYCSYGAFKLLAKNYLDLDFHHLDLDFRQLFVHIEVLLGEIQITPADVAENLMPETTNENCKKVRLENLIEALKNLKKEARLKAAKEGESSRKKETIVTSDDDSENE